MGLGAMLSQDFECDEHPVLFISHKLTQFEKYAIEREALAIKWAITELSV